MDRLYELKDTLCEELKKYGSRDKISAGDLEVVDKLTHTIKNLDKIIENYEDSEYSKAMMPNDYRYSMRRGRGAGAKRDSMGRYSSRYSMDHHMMDELHELMEDAPDEKTRQEFEKFIHKMESM